MPLYLAGLSKRFLVKLKNLLHPVRNQSVSDGNRNPSVASVSAATVEEGRLRNALATNPYLQSKALWNELHGDLDRQLKISIFLNVMLSLVLVIALIGIVKSLMGGSVIPVPFIIHGNEVVSAVQPTTELNSLKPNLALFFAKTFIQYSRSVSSDSSVNASRQMAAFSFVGGVASQVLKEFYEENDPDGIAKSTIKHIHITSVLQTAENTLEVRWQEVSRNSQTGERVSTQDYIGQLHYQYRDPSTNETVLKVNPLGFYITDLTWSRDHQ